MAGTKEQDAVPYADQPLDGDRSGQERRLSADSRLGEGAVIAYLGPDGKPLAATGDREAPFVKPIFDVPGLLEVSAIPQSNAAGVMVAATVCASMHSGWVQDERDPNANPQPADRWLQLFNDSSAPTAGAIPFLAPIRVPAGKLVSIDWTVAPIRFTKGIVLALSTTPNAYSAIAAASDYAMTARVLPGDT